MMDVITIIVTAVCSGSLSWLFTLRYTRQQAKSDAMKSVQDVYQELIEDLRADRSSLRDKISDMEKQLQSLSDEVASNAKKLHALRPFVCYVQDCPNRKIVQNECK